MSQIKPYKIYTIERTNPHTGFKESTTYTGSLRNKPKGWKVVSMKYHAPYIDQFGLTGKY